MYYCVDVEDENMKPQNMIEIPPEEADIIEEFEAIKEKIGAKDYKEVLEFLVTWFEENILENKPKETIKVTVEMPKEVYEFIKEYLDWAGYDFDEGVVKLLLLSIQADLDNVSDTPNYNRFWNWIQELKKS